MGDNKFALIIANDWYADPDLHKLAAPSLDAKDLAQVLADPALGGFEVLPFLLNESSYKVSLAIDEFFADRKRDDLLLLYFSGHGVPDADGQLYFAMTDTRLRQRMWPVPPTAVSAAFVNEAMRKSRSRRQLLLLDCCFSGAFAKAMGIKGGQNVNLQQHFEGEGKLVLASSNSRQFSLEEGTAESEGTRSIFTHALVRGLKTGEADRDGDGLFSLDELYDYVAQRVKDETPGQSPARFGYLEGQIFIARNPNVRPAQLPAEIQQALENPLGLVRVGVIQELDRLLRSKNRGLSLAAQSALITLAKEDYDLRVRDAAEKCLMAFDPDRFAASLATSVVRPPEQEAPPVIVPKPTPEPQPQDQAALQPSTPIEHPRPAKAVVPSPWLTKRDLARLRARKQKPVGEQVGAKRDAEQLEDEKAQQQRTAQAKAEAERKARLEREQEPRIEAKPEPPKQIVGTVVPRLSSVYRKLLWVLAAAVIIVVIVVFVRTPRTVDKPIVSDQSQPATNDNQTTPVQKQVAASETTAGVPESKKTELPVQPASQPTSTEGIVTDAQSGLMWTAKDNGSAISWESADRYCHELTLSGYTGWRLPTAEELNGIYDPGNVSGKLENGNLTIHARSGFQLSDYAVWTGKRDSNSIGFFRFNDGKPFRVKMESIRAYDMVALCVRSSR